MRPLIYALTLCLAHSLVLPAAAQESALKTLTTGDDSRGWDAVGRLNLGTRAFCTGVLITENLVLTAGHCLFDKDSGARINPRVMQFLAGWRNGRAAAYRGVRRAIAHPDFVYSGAEKIDRVAYDLALIELDQPIRLPSIAPFETDARPETGDEVGVVSYAKDRSEAASLQEVCHVLSKQADILVLTCDVDFGASGAPIFSFSSGAPRLVSVVSSKAEVNGVSVALGTSLDAPLARLRAEMAQGDGVISRGNTTVRMLSGNVGGGAKFVKPAAP